MNGDYYSKMSEITNWHHKFFINIRTQNHKLAQDYDKAFLTCLAIAAAKSGGTALPICRFFLLLDP